MDKKIKMIELVRKNGLYLRHLSEEFRGNKEIVLEAIKNDYLALEYASRKLRGNREFILEATKIELHALTYATEELWTDRNFINAAYQIDQYALLYIPEKQLKDHMKNSAFKNTYITLVKTIQKEERMEKTKEFLTLTAARWDFFKKLSILCT